MKKNGFTLIELLGVVTILILIFLLVIPVVTKIIDRGEKTVYDVQIDRILKATYDYSLKNLSTLPERDEKNYISLAELIYSGYIDPIKNPKTDEYFDVDMIISIENVGSKYKNTDKNARKNGEYLYKIEVNEADEETVINNDLTIELTGLDSDELGYTSIIDQGDVFVDVDPVVYDNLGNEITNNVKLVKIILFNDSIAPSVDTSKVGIYTIKYVAILDSDEGIEIGKLNWSIVINLDPSYVPRR